ncbi:MAG: S41 family peptidase [Holophaga sp.]|nr:S41 family peptidase [Holophaga sp.]
MRPLLLFPILISTLVAQVPSVPVTPAQRSAVVEALAKALKERYVFPEVGEKVAKALSEKAKTGAYDTASFAPEFAEALHKDLRELGKDGHFRVRFMPDFQAGPEEERAPTEKEVEEMRLQAARNGFGIARTEILPGNVGYLDVRGFPPTEFAGPAISSALALLSGTDALVLDLRQNGGGSPDCVAYLVSHFFAVGDERHINDIYSRAQNSTRQFWTSPTVSPRYTKPMWILTSGFTFSGGEECAYDFQTQKRATLVGEITGGGANPGDMVPLTHGFVTFIPTGRAVNPVTKTNWEHVGVVPELKTPAADALRVAHLEALKVLIGTEKNDLRKTRLEKTKAMVEKGETEPPRWSRAK